MKAIVGALLIIVVIIIYLWITGTKQAVAPMPGFHGPSGAPSVKGPKGPPPQ